MSFEEPGSRPTDSKAAPGVVPADEATMVAAVHAAVQSGIAAVDASGRQCFVNDAFCRLVGWSREELLGHTPPFVYWPEEELDAIHAEFERVLRGASSAAGARLRFRRRDGSRFPVLLFVAPIDQGGGVAGWVANVIDISEQIQRELELATREQLLREAQSIAGLGHAVRDVDSGEVTWSEEMARILGVEGTRRVPDLQLLRACVVPEDAPASWVWLVAGTDVAPTRLRLQRADGSRAVVIATQRVLRDAGGRPLRIVATLQDVTEREQVEAVLRQTERREALGQLTAGIAHDFGNLLGGLIASLERAAARTRDDAEVHALVDTALVAALSGRERTRSLLALVGQAPAGGDVASIDLNERLRRLLPLLESSVGAGIVVQLCAADEALPVRVDGGQLDSAIINLVVNARDALGQGGTVTLTTRWVGEAAAAAAGLAPGPCAALEVADDGVGMDEETCARAFDPFYTTKGAAGGTGLGLAMVFGFCRAAGGDAHIDSWPGTGTRVSLLLPLAAAQAVPAAVGPEPRAARRILVVDDDLVLCELASTVLRERGDEVAVAESCGAALALLQEADFDIVVSDVMLQADGSGLDVAAWVAAHAPATRVILTSGVPPPTLPAGVVGFLPKPYRIAELDAAIAAVTGGV